MIHLLDNLHEIYDVLSFVFLGINLLLLLIYPQVSDLIFQLVVESPQDILDLKLDLCLLYSD